MNIDLIIIAVLCALQCCPLVLAADDLADDQEGPSNNLKFTFTENESVIRVVQYSPIQEIVLLYLVMT